MLRQWLGGLVTCVVLWSLASPSSALAQCVARSPAAISGDAEVIVDAVALPASSSPDGRLLSPARFRVERYDKGTGPNEIDVVTGDLRTPDGVFASVSEALHVVAGERWRLIGSDDAGRLTPACGASAQLPEELLPPMIRSGSRWIALSRSRYSGRGAISAPTVHPSRPLRIAVRDRDEAPVVRLGSQVLSARRAGPNRFLARLPARLRGRRLVIETRWGFWTANLRSTR
jgi:hypothetical protein